MKTLLALALTAAFTVPAFSTENSVGNVQTTSVSAEDAFVLGHEHLRRETPEDLKLAQEYLEKAVALDPGHGEAHAALALVYYKAFQRGWNRQLRMGWNTARLRSGKHMAEARKNPTPLMHRVNSEMVLRVGRAEEALTEAEIAIALDPNDPENVAAAAHAMIFLGRSAEAMKMADAALRSDPQFPARYLYVKGLAAFSTDEFEAAAGYLEGALEHDPLDHRASAILAAALGHLGRMREARSQFDAYFDGQPNDTSKGRMTDQSVWLRWPYTNEADWLRLAKGLELASGEALTSSVVTSGTMNENSFFEFMLGKE